MSRAPQEASEREDSGVVPRGARSPNDEDDGFPLLPLVGFVAIWLGGSWLVVGGWLHRLLPGGWDAVAAGLALAVVPVLQLVRGLRCRAYPSAAARLLVLRPFWYAMLFLPILALATLLGALAGMPFGASRAVGDRALGATAALLAVAALAGFAGSRKLVLRRFEVRMPRLPVAFDGLRVVQISDLHVGPHTPRRFLERVGRAVREAGPDLIAVTGDQVDDFSRDVEVFAGAFGDLEAPLGVFAVAGNHDVYAGWDAVRDGLAAAGLRVLVNDAVPVERVGERLWIAGTGDPAGLGWRRGGGRHAAPDLARTLLPVPSDEPVLALAHNPALWPALAARGVDLTLSGHTHYGQLAIPALGWCAASPFLELAMGTHRAGRSLLYIHPGTLFWGLPLRIGTPPEVAVLTLRRDAAGEAGCECTSTEPRFCARARREGEPVEATRTGAAPWWPASPTGRPRARPDEPGSGGRARAAPTSGSSRRAPGSGGPRWR